MEQNGELTDRARLGDFALAMDAPVGDTVLIDDSLIEAAIARSRKSTRRRIILPLHSESGESLHRMLNALQPGTYIRPHRHQTPPKAESLLLLRGSIGFLVFDEVGEVTQSVVLSANSARLGIDCRPGTFHTFVALQPDTVVFEVKPGPYDHAGDKDFAPWAPDEWSREAQAYLRELEKRFRAV